MKILGLNITKTSRKEPEVVQVEPPAQQERPAVRHEGRISYDNIFSISYNGEKNVGEIGPIIKYRLDYDGLRLRSWQAYLDSEIAQIVIHRFCTWVIGSGLKLQCEPQTDVLKSEKIDMGKPEEFNNIAESRFRVYAGSKIPSYSGMENLHKMAEDAFKNAIVGGDVLVVLRFIDNEVKVELIDGGNVVSPLNARLVNGVPTAENGNRIVHGIEIDKTRRHIAYHVRTSTFTYERIPARGERSGMEIAFMVYGLGYRLNDIRGIPLIVAVMETVKKLERYKEATVGSAEERQKIPFFIKHGVSSTGENPMAANIVKALGGKPGDIPEDSFGNKLADTIAATTNKQVFNMPNDSELMQLDSRNELSFGEFYMKNFDIVCATIEIPPNVALSKYDANFSASRAALKDWEHTLGVKRKRFSDQFYQIVYNLWLHTQILRNKVEAPGYLTAFSAGNQMALESYRTARFAGANVPHIDPVKEVTAERLKLGTNGAGIPLTTAEAATEALNGGDFYSNLDQFSIELQDTKDKGINTGSQPVEDKEPKEEN